LARAHHHSEQNADRQMSDLIAAGLAHGHDGLIRLTGKLLVR
jgi:hypothetical protein